MNEVLDQKVLIKLSEDVGPEIVPQFLQSVRVEITSAYLAMESALVGRDMEALAMKAHTIKAACGTAGLLQLERLASALQEASEQGNAERVGQIMGTLPSLILVAFGALDSCLADL